MKALLVPALLLAAAPAVAQPTDDNAAILATAHAFDQAQQTGDRATLERMVAPDFLLVHGTGKVGDRRDFIDGFAGPGIKLDPFVIRDPLFLRPSPDVAIVGGEAWVNGSEGGKRFAAHFRYSDTFARRDGRWLAVYTQVTPLPPSRPPLQE